MAEVLTAPQVLTGDGIVTDGAVLVSDGTIGWVGKADALPSEFASVARTGYPGATIMPGLIDSHVHLAFDGGPNPAARMRAETGEQQLMLMLPVSGPGRCSRWPPPRRRQPLASVPSPGVWPPGTTRI